MSTKSLESASANKHTTYKKSSTSTRLSQLEPHCKETTSQPNIKFEAKSHKIVARIELSESFSSEDQDLTLHATTADSVCSELELDNPLEESELDNDDDQEYSKCRSKYASYVQNDDVIPFDECEYEKIVIHNQVATSTSDQNIQHRHKYPSSESSLVSSAYSYATYSFITKYKTKSKSLSCIHDRVTTCVRLSNRYLTRTMSNVDLDDANVLTTHIAKQQQQHTQTLIKTSKTESEIFSLATAAVNVAESLDHQQIWVMRIDQS